MVGSWEELPNIDGSEKCICRGTLSFRVRMLLKGAITKFWETCVAIHLHALTITSYNTMISVENAHDKISISVQ